MPRNGSGGYTLPSGSWNPAVTGTTVDPTDWNAVAADFETAMSDSIARDGQTTTTAVIPFASGIKSDTISENSPNAGVTADGVLLKDGDIELKEALVFEGETTDAFKTTLKVINPTANRTVNIPDLSGTTLLNVVEDTSPQLGGNLNLNSNALDFPTTSGITDCLDEDDMVSDSATALVTQQSTKAYVDTKVIGVSDAIAYDFVSTSAITAVSSLEVTGLAAGYDYMFELEAFVPNTDANELWMRLSTDNGSTYESGASDYGWQAVVSLSASNDASDSKIALTGNGGGGTSLGNDAGSVNTIGVTLINPNAGGERATSYWLGTVMGDDASTSTQTVRGGGVFRQGVTAVNAVQFLWSSGGNFKAQGDITVWRRKRSQ